MSCHLYYNWYLDLKIKIFVEPVPVPCYFYTAPAPAPAQCLPICSLRTNLKKLPCHLFELDLFTHISVNRTYRTRYIC